VLRRKPNIIKTQFVDVEVENPSNAFEFKDHLSDVCRNKLLPAIEKLFDAKSSGTQIISIDSLQINAGTLEKEDWENRLVEETIKRLTEYLDNIQAGHIYGVQNQQAEAVKGSGVTLSDDGNESKAILHFLKFGVLPWYSSIKSQSELTATFKGLINKDNKFIEEVRQLSISDKKAFDRIVMQFAGESVIKILVEESTKSLVEDLYISWRKIFEVLHISAQEQKIKFFTALRSVIHEGRTKRFTESITVMIQNTLEEEQWELLVRVADKSDEYNFAEKEKHILKYIRKDKNKKDEIKKDDAQKLFENNDDATQLEENPIYITNAGLVLLHPFISSLFANIGYTKKDEFISDELQQRALVLCQYLVSGGDEYAEFELLLNKILTGYAVEESLPSEIELSDFEKKEAEDLLKSVIKHWSALKNTSVEGLRQTFLQRDGKIVRADTGWLLQVEQNTVDILLNKLPWGFSTIKTPWMKEILSVEWT